MRRPGEGEPPAGPWQMLTPDEWTRRVRQTTDAVGGRPAIVGVGGRSGGGKSTAAARLAAGIPGAVVVHTDDLAWWEPLFEWRHLLIDHVLAPLREGREVLFTPPEWTRRGRLGGVHVPSDAAVVVIEGVGATEIAFDGMLDLAVWVQSDPVIAEERGLARDLASGVHGDIAGAKASWDAWMAAEHPFLAADRPWERADWIVAGNLGLDIPPEVIGVAVGPLVSGSSPTSRAGRSPTGRGA